MHISKKFYTGIIIFFVLTSLTVFAQESKTKNTSFDLKNLDQSVSPTKDFYQFSCGGWVKNHPIPDDQTRWGSFTILAEDNNKQLKEIIEAVAANKNWPKGSPEQKIGDMYRTGMDSAQIENSGYKPIASELKKIDALQNKSELTKFIGERHASGRGGFFNLFITADAKKSTTNAPYLSEGGISLQDVEYYTKDDARSKQIREKYVLHVANMFKLIDVDAATAEKYSQTIMNIETKFAKVSNTRLENRDPIKTYNKMTIENLNNMSNGFDWATYLSALGKADLDIIIVRQPKFFTELGNIVNEVSLDDWKIYLKWNLLRTAAQALSTPFVNELFDFNGKFMTGAKVIQPRWKRVVATISGTMGELLGQIYVKKYFPPESKERAQKIVGNILVSMGESIKGLEWMSPATKEQALKKLSAFGVKIGYPDKWKDYTALNIENDTYYKNLERAIKWARIENFAKNGKPVEKLEWGMTPQTVNASYNPTKNEITFPAAILQPPFFDPKADDAINYGAMGAVIGHEITHGFDDQGRKYDAEGNIKDWWTKEDNDKFKVRAQKLIDEYNSFSVIDTFRVNGALTLGENIGDLGGLTISYAAFKKTEQFKQNEKIDGFTPAQRYFLGWAQVWATNSRPEALKLQVKTDVHSPSVQRVNGPMMNMPEFFEAFDVKSGDPMRNPEDKIVKIW